MLANVVNSPAWKITGYVCVACRRHQQLTKRQQLRWNSEVADANANRQDSWFDTLNDISDTYGEKKPLQPRGSEDEGGRKSKKTSAQDNVDVETLFDLTLANSHSKAKRSTSSGSTKIRTYNSTPRIRRLKPVRSQPAASSIAPVANAQQKPPEQQEPSEQQQPSADFGSLLKRLKAEGKIQPATRSVSSGYKQAEQDQHREQDQYHLGVDDQGVEEAKPCSSFAAWRASQESYNAPLLRQNHNEERVATSEPAAEAVSESALDEPSYLSATVVPPDVPNGELPKDNPQPRIGAIARLVDRWKAMLQRSTSTPWGIKYTKPTEAGNSLGFDALRKADKVTPEEFLPSSVTQNPYGLPPTRTKRTPETARGQSVGTFSSTVDAPNTDDKDATPTSIERLPGDLSAFNRPNISRARETSSTDAREPQQAVSAQESTRAAQESAQVVLQELTDLRNSYSHVASDIGEVVAVGTSHASEGGTISQIEPRIDIGAKTKVAERRRWRKSSTNRDTAAVKDRSERLGSRRKTKGSTTAAHESGAHDAIEERITGRTIAEAMKSSKQTSEPVGPEPSSSSEPARLESSSSPSEEPAVMDDIFTIHPSKLEVRPLDIPQPPVPFLEYGLDRVLFNPGVYQLQDPASRVFNFDPYLQKIMPVVEFDFNSLKQYKTSSQDVALAALAQEHSKKYIGSTSSMTSSLAHFHYLLSNWRPLNLDMLSDGFVGKGKRTDFTQINRAPSSIFLRWKNGSYAIDADKEYDGANVLMLLGKSMELLLTLPKDEYERYRKSDPRQIPEEQKTAPESYQYTTMRDFLMRSQLDAYDPRLPGSGTFDLKTRAVVSVRMSSQDFEPMTGYEIFGLQGQWGSYEREHYDMMRATMLKYMLQARMGRMNGIFVAYHNVKRIFGFQYLPIHEMDRILHGQSDVCLGDQEFRASLDMFNSLLDKATAKFPEQSLRIHFEAQPEQQDEGKPTSLHVFAEPMAEDEIDRIQNSQKAKIAAFERAIMGVEEEAAVENKIAQEAQETVMGAESGNVIDAEASVDVTEDSARDDSKSYDEEATSYAREQINLNSSDAPGDKDFLDTISKDGQDLKPLFYATIIVQSKVNGNVPKEDRPENLRPGDEWEIDYILKEYDTTQEIWGKYDDAKARRRHALYEGREDEDNVDAESDGADKKEDGYIRFLQMISAKGRERRGRIDELEAGMDLVRVDEGLPRQRELIDGVEDYMEWLYRTRDG